MPADLVTASGSGLDPHISMASAKFQAPRIARARGLEVSQVLAMLDKPESGKITVPLLGEPLINVLELNRALDRQKKPQP